MNRSIIERIEDALSFVKDDEKLDDDYTVLAVDIVRSILTSLLSSKAISQATITIANLIDAFKCLKVELQSGLEEDRLICLDTSELLSSIYPNYEWFFCLSSIFREPKNISFFISPWFFCETFQALKHRALSRPITRFDEMVFDELNNDGYLARYLDQFTVKQSDNYILLKNQDWDSVDLDLEVDCLSSMEEICRKRKQTYFSSKMIKLFNMRLIETSQKYGLMDSLREYGTFSTVLKHESNSLLNFRKKLLYKRRYYSSMYNKNAYQVAFNASIDSIVYGYLNWLREINDEKKDKIHLLTRDSLHNTVSEFHNLNKTYLRSFNPQELFLIWSFVETKKSNQELIKFCDESISKKIGVKSTFDL